jgi:ABC-type nitrate/sulfonate/bicarbonate transport system permease component
MRRALALAQGLVLPVALVALWWVLTNNSHSTFFPPLREIVASFRANWLFADDRSDLEPSVIHFIAGLALAIGFGVLGGVLLGLSLRSRSSRGGFRSRRWSLSASCCLGPGRRWRSR